MATQALIAAYSKTPHYDPANPDAHLPTGRDEVGLIRAVAVKVRLGVLALMTVQALTNQVGTIFIEAQRDMENCSNRGWHHAAHPTDSGHEGLLVLHACNA